jgi:WD40 repeat protein
VTAAAFDPSGRRLVSAGEDRTLRVWEVAAGREVLRFRSPVRAVTAIGASGDGLRVAVGDSEGGIHVYHPRNSSYSPVLRAHQGPVRALAFSPDGRRLISGGQDAAVMVWGE